MALREPPPKTEFWDLLDVSRVPGADGVSSFLQQVLERCLPAFGASRASVFLRTGSAGAYSLAACTGQRTGVLKNATIRAGSGVAGTAIELEQPMLVLDPKDKAALARRVSASRDEIGSSIVVPLVTPESGCLGVLNLSRNANLAPFSEGDVAQVAGIARQLALAVANARLFDEMEGTRRRLGAVIENLAVAVVVLSADGTLAEVNPEAESRLGARSGETLRNWLERLPEILGVAVEEAVMGARAGRVYRRQVRREEQAWTVTASPMPDGGANVAIEDASEHFAAEQELARTRRLAEIGQMTAAIAHEIRNPLTGIRSAAQMVREAPEQSAEFARIIEEETLKLNALCEEFLEFARPLALRLASVDLAAVCGRVADRLHHQFEGARVSLHVQITANPPIIEADGSRLEQVLRNLLLNALQASAPGGTVRLRVREYGVVVEDDGIGMSEQTVSRLFTAFFTTRPNGTGLGLSTVRKIVEAHGWRVAVRSELGEGTRFTIRFHQKESN
jgi:signal transduction histidine kinase